MFDVLAPTGSLVNENEKKNPENFGNLFFFFFLFCFFQKFKKSLGVSPRGEPQLKFERICSLG